MRKKIKENRQKLIELLSNFIATDKNGAEILQDVALESAAHMFIEQSNKGGKIIFIGNGGSAAIASHMAVDFWKNVGIKAISFNDGALLTCVSNDYGYTSVFEKPVEMFAEKEDVLVAISSSGNSENILRGVLSAGGKELRIITFSGFSQDNLLRSRGEINFYVPAAHYGHVEVAHHALCHCLVDILLESKSRLSRNNACLKTG